jgi:hypothetical protein
LACTARSPGRFIGSKLQCCWNGSRTDGSKKPYRCETRCDMSFKFANWSRDTAGGKKKLAGLQG